MASISVGSALLDEMQVKFKALLPELRTHASGPGGVLDLGLAASVGGACKILEVSCSGQVVFPVVNTILAEAFKAHGLHFNWTSVRVCFGSQVEWSRMGSWLGSAALVCLVGDGPITLQQHRSGRADHCSEVRKAPLLLDPCVSFRVVAEGSSRPFALAFQHRLKAGLASGSVGRLKALGCVVDEPKGWMVPRRVAIDPVKVASGEVLYVGPGPSALGLQPSSWTQDLTSGPVLSKIQALELFVRDLELGTAAMVDYVTLEGRRIMCQCPFVSSLPWGRRGEYLL